MDNKHKILIVEDEVALLKVLTDKFSDEGFEVIQAHNGEEGLSLALESRPDIILLDIIMPKMDGMTMLRKLREHPWGKDARVIVLSNLSNSKDVEEALRNGVFDYLVKTNWKLDAVVNKVRESLARG